MQENDLISFQDLIFLLQKYWSEYGCSIIQPIDIEVGAGTAHPMTCLRSVGPEPISIAYIQPSRRPMDSRYGKNPNRLQNHYQFQVVLKPSPEDMIDLYLKSLKRIYLDFSIHDIRFVEGNWENPTLGSWGKGWEIWLDGMEITQFTYFQQVAGLECSPITGEITYGLERLAMCLQNVKSVYEIVWNKNSIETVLYGDLFYQNEVEQSCYNLENTNLDFLFLSFKEYEKRAKKLIKLEHPLPLPAYECILKALHSFNLLDSRRAISHTERQNYILRLQSLIRHVAKVYYNSRKSLNFPMYKK